MMQGESEVIGSGATPGAGVVVDSRQPPIITITKMTVEVWDGTILIPIRFVDEGKEWEIYVSDLRMSERDEKMVKKLATKIIEEAGGSVDWCGVYRPNDKLLLLVQRLMKKYQVNIWKSITKKMMSELEEKEARIRELEAYIWRIKKAVRRYLNASERDRQFLADRKQSVGGFTFFLPLGREWEERARSFALKYPDYVQYVDDQLKYTEDAKLLIDGQDFVESE